jgi:glutathione peroxidase
VKIVLAALALTAAVSALALSAIAQDKPATAPATDRPAALDFKVKDIDGKEVDLVSYKGKVLMILNVASKCGNTPQYTALQAMYTKYKDKGLVVMGFPANNFGGQEPGSELDIKTFCTEEYKVDFPLFSKVSAKGNDIAPLFKYLTAQESKPLSKGDIRWNFEKFLISREGKLVGRFADRTKPDDPTVVSAVEAALAAK